MDNKTFDKYLQRKYGITLKQRDAMFKKQKGACAICKKPETAFKRRLGVDHNHRTGQTRALLCMYCNRRLVGRHSKKTAKQVYDYLMKYDKEGCL